MPEITKGFHLVNGGTTLSSAPSMVQSSWTKITTTGGANLCIKDFPEMDNADPDQVETTTLCDDAHKYMDGLKNLPDELTFTANFDEALMDKINTDYGAEAWWGLEKGEAVASGDKCPLWYFTGKARCVLSGGGVGDVAEMIIKIKPTGVIAKDQVAYSV